MIEITCSLLQRNCNKRHLIENGSLQRDGTNKRFYLSFGRFTALSFKENGGGIGELLSGKDVKIASPQYRLTAAGIVFFYFITSGWLHSSKANL